MCVCKNAKLLGICMCVRLLLFYMINQKGINRATWNLDRLSNSSEKSIMHIAKVKIKVKVHKSLNVFQIYHNADYQVL